MRLSPDPRWAAVFALLLACPASGAGQERDVVSKEVSVGRTEASLRLEFADGGRLSVSLSDGSVVVDGRTLGPYATGDALDRVWRQLLGESVALEDGPLARRLREWAPPATLEGEALALARLLDAALDEALALPSAPSAPDAPRPPAGAAVDAAILRVLADRDPATLLALGEAVRELGPGVRLHVGEDVLVAAGETVTGNLLVVQGDLRVEGTVEGDVMVLDGTLEVPDGGRVEGDVRLLEADLERRGGTVAGAVRDLAESHRDLDAELRERLRAELRRELRQEMGRSNAAVGIFQPFRRIFSGLGGVIENVVSVLILGLVGMGVLAFAPRNLEVVADAARRAPGRAAMVGVAGAFLLIPVWVLGLVALVVSIVGIPVAIAWIPLFPLAAVAAALLGYLAVARNLGEWLAESDYPYTGWISRSSAATTIMGGLAALAVLFIAGNILGIVPFFGFFKGLLTAVGAMASVAAVTVGFGAVIITRGGRHSEYVRRDFDDAWRRAMDMEDEGAATSRSASGGPGDDLGDPRA
jgi:hypothetical protein